MLLEMMESVLGDVSDSKSRVLLYLTLLGNGLSLIIGEEEKKSDQRLRSATVRSNEPNSIGGKERKRTVRSLMRVDFPAPLGPRIPTRDERVRAHETS